jgi:excisionase family DNA binding protein
VTKQEIIAALAQIEADRAALMAQLIAHELKGEPEDALLTVGEAATILRVTTDWLYRHARTLPFTVRPGPGQVRFSRTGLQEYLKKQRR